MTGVGFNFKPSSTMPHIREVSRRTCCRYVESASSPSRHTGFDPDFRVVLPKGSKDDAVSTL